ncbi:uncharacterized protein LOC119876016 isoform X2 [Canis lupus familiaris]|uniref:uncharacterized protein LOC119876016 isoform X2 n=1 Tax=Canis lupus familiaris TaxID=9615 RepID=UPI0018F561CA|nr:uncharacterized protein LOC119876016 isoform X2 [Canis lupus familiaris]
MNLDSHCQSGAKSGGIQLVSLKDFLPPYPSLHIFRDAQGLGERMGKCDLPGQAPTVPTQENLEGSNVHSLAVRRKEQPLEKRGRREPRQGCWAATVFQPPTWSSCPHACLDCFSGLPHPCVCSLLCNQRKSIKTSPLLYQIFQGRSRGTVPQPAISGPPASWLSGPTSHEGDLWLSLCLTCKPMHMVIPMPVIPSTRQSIGGQKSGPLHITPHLGSGS